LLKNDIDLGPAPVGPCFPAGGRDPLLLKLAIQGTGDPIPIDAARFPPYSIANESIRTRGICQHPGTVKGVRPFVYQQLVYGFNSRLKIHELNLPQNRAD
jgi:hypothetical protein